MDAELGRSTGTATTIDRRGVAHHHAHIHGALIFFALLGGLAVFGPIGLLLGPLCVAFFLAVLRIYERDYGLSSARPGDPVTPPQNQPTVGEGEEWEPSGLHLNEDVHERPHH